MSNFEALFDYIQEISGKLLSEDDKHLLMEHFKPKKLRKRQYFLQEGDVCKNIGFIVKGSARTFTVDEKGHEHILKLSLENWWLADFESFYLLTPSRFNIEALEDLEVLQSTNAQIEEYLKHIPAFSSMANVISQNYTIANQKRMQAAISYTAEERYEDLISNYPQFLQRFPQNMIASYLGLSPETLSRLKKNSFK
ncbi:cAMP-binding domain of CRP or a regulatory subunit of cAMP-dependent protein kinases [Mucilaginibacter mallensis]|uniref:cAMP-binding domain of CRP or a regulatory subunit of cAMP-dependent protein kinases n=1 Tax=Mucilaginibacter mallensis TaxID=652787 RepID=A0A1H1SQ22_MUCMA|nr:Crp/Fnr family transcriptional regulator [Mucilaginibacter mallensis]SDS50084.1 cAMP-binding domain of CRP or a regulatory subunit of cAMP-dependent protein kinases [Mucilaginibacter mallensis]